MKKLLALAALILASCAQPTAESKADIVVSSCGTLPGAAYPIGSSVQPSVDNHGVTCTSGRQAW